MKISKFLLVSIILFASFAIYGNAHADITTGLVGYYDFNDGTATDQSGNNNHGTIYGAVPTTGKVDNALLFDGTDDYVDIGDIDLTDAFTISAWIKVNDLSASRTLVGKTDSSYRFSLLTNGRIHFQRNSTKEVTSKFNLVNVDTWYHMIATFNIAEGTNIYLDGTNVGASNTLNTTAVNNAVTKIGAFGWTPKIFFSGIMDDVRIYDRALTSSDITELFSYRGEQVAAPTVTINTEVSITDTSATVNGIVNPNGADTTIYFEYGKTSGIYDDQTPTQTITGSSHKAISAAINLNLGTNVIYYYRIVASNEADTVYSNELSFDRRDIYIHDTVTEPLLDEARLIIPDELIGNDLASLGFVDVTASPFNADPTGKQDSTHAIQIAANLARDYQMVLYFPLGTYKVSDTVSCIQGYYRRSTGVVAGSVPFFCSWMGESSKVGQRPKIILAPNSNGFSDQNNPKYMIHFWTRDPDDVNKDRPNRAYSQQFSNIDIELGGGNSGAVGIRLRGAEGSGISSVTIDATNGYAGVSGGAGSGGSHSDIKIIGGRIGMDLTQAQFTPTLVGITLENQTETAIIYGGVGSLSAVGLDITSQTAGPVIKVEPFRFQVYFYGPISIADSKITFTGNQPNTIAIGTADRSVYLNNVYVKGADSVLTNPDNSDFPANKNGWIRINEYAYEVTPPTQTYNKESIQYYHSVYVNGVKSSNIVDYEIDVSVPSDLVSQHLWDNTFPHWDSPGAVNVKLSPYNAKGDGYTDDTIALQTAINENEIVFLPKGFYRISSTIKLKPNTKLVGIEPYFSNIIIRNDEGYFTNPTNAKPLIETADSSTAYTVLDGIGIYVPRETPGAYALKWQSGGDSIVRRARPRMERYHADTLIEYDKQRSHPLTLITSNGGGKWYKQYSARGTMTHPDYRNILVDGIEGPLNFYMLTSQHEKSDANTEILNSKYVTIFGLKGEGVKPIIKIKDSDYIRIFAYGGNGAPELDYPLYQIENTPNFVLSNILSRTRFDVFSDSDNPGRHPSEWNIVKEIDPDGKSFLTPPYERPVVYKRETFINQPPVSSAGPNQTIKDADNNGSELIILDGSASSDPDGTIASYVWKEETTQIATGINPTVTLGVGSHIITLTVTDNDGDPNIDTVVITINTPSGDGDGGEDGGGDRDDGDDGDDSGSGGLVAILDMIDSFYATGSPPLLEILDTIDVYYSTN